MCRDAYNRMRVPETEHVLNRKGRQKNIKKAKGVKQNVIKKQTTLDQYKDALFGEKQLWYGMNILRSDGHEIYGMHVNKISLSPFDSKRWIAEDGIHTHAYGYNPAAKEADLLAAEQYLQFRLRG